MKRIFFITAVVIATFSLKANAQPVAHASVSIEGQETRLSIVNDSTSKASLQDTSIVKVGKKDVKVIRHEGGTEYVWGKGKKHKKSGNFDGHWEGIEVGFNSFANSDYSLYNGVEFMSLNQSKSLEFDLNFGEVNVGLYKSYIGLVSGLGFSFNDYRFENPYTIARGSLMNQAVPLTYDGLSKNKLSVSYFKVPLLMEFQIPVNDKHDRLYINGGIIGGVRIGSHTKVKHGDTKDKDRSSFYINSFKYEATARIGYKGIGLFANYNLNPLFRDGKGPELTPFTVGISFLDQ